MKPVQNSQHCMPNCEETRYSASLSAAKFHLCNSKTMGSNPMCNLPKGVIGSEGAVDIPMWGTSVMEDYRKVFQIITM